MALLERISTRIGDPLSTGISGKPGPTAAASIDASGRVRRSTAGRRETAGPCARRARLAAAHARRRPRQGRGRQTSITANVAATAALGGWRTLAVDLDSQGNVARDAGYRERSDEGRALLEAVMTARSA